MFACYSSGQLSVPYIRKSKAGSSKEVATHCVGEPFVTGHKGCQSYAEEQVRGKFAYVNVTVCVSFTQLSLSNVFHCYMNKMDHIYSLKKVVFCIFTKNKVLTISRYER